MAHGQEGKKRDAVKIGQSSGLRMLKKQVDESLSFIGARLLDFQVLDGVSILLASRQFLLRSIPTLSLFIAIFSISKCQPKAAAADIRVGWVERKTKVPRASRSGWMIFNAQEMRTL